MKVIDLLEVLLCAHSMSGDAEVRMVGDDIGETTDIEQALVVKNGGTVEVWLCELAVMDER